MSKYINFIETKGHYGSEVGLPISEIPDCLFDYQKHVTDIAARFGRFACFLDTGLGKTIIELTLAQHFAEKTNKPTLILTPLAVAFQFEQESEKFNLCEVEHTKDGSHKRNVVTCNYERIHKLIPDDFGCVILDESSILKNFDGLFKGRITEFLKRVKYRYLFTATPAPNDFVELGTNSEALGFLGYMDMLSMFFTNKEKTSDPSRIGSPWYLKPHAEDEFFSWVNSWSISAKRPSDMGFSDEKFILPELLEINHELAFDSEVKQKLTFKDIRKIQKDSVPVRVEKAVSLASGHGSTVFWCHRNDESQLIKDSIDCEELKGSMSIDKKEEIIKAFSVGEVKRLVTKPKITGFGLNWQHCCHATYFPTYSYEQYYQSIRRFWRFGQNLPVHVDRIYTTAEHPIIQSLEFKSIKAEKLYIKLNEKMNSKYVAKADSYDQSISMPSFF